MVTVNQAALIVERNAKTAAALARALLDAGLESSHAASLAEARDHLANEAFELAFIEYDLPDGTPAQFIEEAGRLCPGLPVVILCKSTTAGSAADLAAALGADYLRTPFTSEEVSHVAQRALSSAEHAAQKPAAENAALNPAKNLETRSRSMRDALGLADRAACGNTTVLVRGESGVGKEVLARRIHDRGPRRDQPFLKVHCAALPEQILESELFGYEKGAFTGANTRKPGRFELAERGTIFLDEIGDISASVQVKLLRVLQDREYERLGGTKTIRADVRIIAATHRNLERMVKTREFREDLYYRLNVVSITVPPLRARPDHVEELARHFVRVFSEANGRQAALTSGGIDALKRAPWPGNVRQLQNVIERLIVLGDSPTIDEDAVVAELERDTGSSDELSVELSTLDLQRSMQKAERKVLRRALERAQGNRALAARLLGVSRRTLFYKIRQYDLE